MFLVDRQYILEEKHMSSGAQNCILLLAQPHTVIHKHSIHIDKVTVGKMMIVTMKSNHVYRAQYSHYEPIQSRGN